MFIMGVGFFWIAMKVSSCKSKKMKKSVLIVKFDNVEADSPVPDEKDAQSEMQRVTTHEIL